jgi:hypothetical protein
MPLRRLDPKIKGTMTEVVIAEGALNGLNNTQLAEYASKKLGQTITTKHVKELMSRETVQTIIDSQYQRIVGILDKATDNIISAVTSYSPKQDADAKKISWEATKEVSRSLGTLAAPTQSVVHNTFINQQHNTVIPPVIAELMAKHFGNIIDVKEITHEERPSQEG